MKKTFALLLVLLLITGMLAACAEKEKEPDTPPSPPQPQYQDAKPLAEALDQAEGYNYTYIHETEYGKATISRNGDDVYILDESEDRINKTAYVKDTGKNQFRLYRFDLTENCWKQYVATPTQYQMNLQGLLEEMEFQRKQILPALKDAEADSSGAYSVKLSDGRSVRVFAQNDVLIVQSDSDSVRFSAVGTSEVPLTDEMKNAPEEKYTHSQF